MVEKGSLPLKQAPRAWCSNIDNHFIQQWYERNETEHTLYKKVLEDGSCILISLYVDDIVYTSGLHALIEQFKDEMMKTFDMLDLGLMKFFLGLEVNQLTEGIFIS